MRWGALHLLQGVGRTRVRPAAQEAQQHTQLPTKLQPQGELHAFWRRGRVPLLSRFRWALVLRARLSQRVFRQRALRQRRQVPLR